MAVAVSKKVPLSLLHPKTLLKVNALLDACRAKDVPILITSGFRSAAEQDALYASGRTAPGRIVTNARGTDMASMHNWGLAVDYCKNAPAQEYSDTKFFFAVADIAESVGFEAGARWVNFRDLPHLQDNQFGAVEALKKKYGTLEAFQQTWGNS